MLSTKNLISDLSEVPREWIFEHYLKLDEKLTGQDVKMKSLFNPADKRPSMFIFWSKTTKNYCFKDFSTGISGDSITLVKTIFNLNTRGEAAYKVITDYNQFTLNNKEDYSLREFKVQQRFKVTEFVKAGWNTLDQKYWTQYHIGSKILDKYNVCPLESYKMTKEDDADKHELVVKGRHYIYGYFRTDGTLYKIYQPMVKDSKFIKVREYIQGTEQLTYKTNYLIITSSMKDIMGLVKLHYPEIEIVAPDSENTLIGAHVINTYKSRYKNVCMLFDNDDAGIKAAKKYHDAYGLKNALLPMSKDLTDSIRDHGIRKVKEVLTPLLKQALK